MPAEPGWYTAEGVGGICREADGKWWFYPLRGRKKGPFETLTEAKQKARPGVPNER